MLRSCRKILKELRKLSNNSEDTLAFLGETTCICRADDQNQMFDYSKYQMEIHNHIQQLADDGYLEYDGNQYFFTLTLRGLHPYQFIWEDIKSFLLRSILVPIGVSVITSIATILVLELLGLTQ